ncbi:MAG: hypothetical protein HY721_03440, partial [Planctomycetes bacterium]|nr:hypothetical protein [Planctomycetota bacterium]
MIERHRTLGITTACLAFVLASAGARGQDGAGAAAEFIRGDADMDGRVTISDGFHLARALFVAGVLRCFDAADYNDDGGLNLSDLLLFLNWAYLAVGSPPGPPFPSKGPDPTPNDGLDCADPNVVPPVADSAYRMEWIHPPQVRPGLKDVEVFLSATTAGAIGCLYLAYRVDRRYFENARVDFEGTILPPPEREPLRLNKLFFLAEVTPLAHPRFDLLRVQVIFNRTPNEQIPFPATLGPMPGPLPLLRLLVDVLPDAPVGPAQPVMISAAPADLEPNRPAGLNEYCRAQGAVIPGTLGTVRLEVAQAPEFVRGDANMSGRVSPVDPTFILEYVFKGGPAPRCKDAADSNNDGEITVADALHLLNFLFLAGQPPPAPFPTPGTDPADPPDALDCAETVVVPPPLDPAYGIAWENKPLVPRGWKDFEMFMLATTAAPIECFALAYRLDRRLAKNVRVDFKDTLFPQDKREAFEKNGFFEHRVTPIVGTDFDLLQVGATFAEPRGGPGSPFQTIEFDATQRALHRERLLRVVFDIPADAPVGPATFLEPVPIDQVPPGTGFYNELTA